MRRAIPPATLSPTPTTAPATLTASPIGSNPPDDDCAVATFRRRSSDAARARSRVGGLPRELDAARPREAEPARFGAAPADRAFPLADALGLAAPDDRGFAGAPARGVDAASRFALRRPGRERGRFPITPESSSATAPPIVRVLAEPP
jgi:hypothetical protein